MNEDFDGPWPDDECCPFCDAGSCRDGSKCGGEKYLDEAVEGAAFLATGVWA